MNNLKLDILRILKNNYKSKTQKVTEEIFEEIERDLLGEVKAFILQKTKEQILEVAAQIGGKDARNDADNSNRIITLP